MTRVPEPQYLSTFSMLQLTTSLGLVKKHLESVKQWGIRLRRKKEQAKGNTKILFEPEQKRYDHALKTTVQRIADLTEAIRIKRSKQKRD